MTPDDVTRFLQALAAALGPKSKPGALAEALAAGLAFHGSAEETRKALAALRPDKGATAGIDEGRRVLTALLDAFGAMLAPDPRPVLRPLLAETRGHTAASLKKIAKPAKAPAKRKAPAKGKPPGKAPGKAKPAIPAEDVERLLGAIEHGHDDARRAAIASLAKIRLTGEALKALKATAQRFTGSPRLAKSQAAALEEIRDMQHRMDRAGRVTPSA